MALLQRTRPLGEAVPESTDELLRYVIRSGTAGPEIWCEWRVQMPNGRYDYRSARVDADVEAAIFGATAYQNNLTRVANNTYPKVTADL